MTAYRNNFPKIEGLARLSAVASTLSGGISTVASTIVNANTSYTFVVVIADAMSSSGKIKITVPNTVAILATSASCATLTGNNVALNPTCSYNTT